MISTFTSADTTDPLVNYLIQSDENRALIPVPLQALKRKASKENADPACTFKFTIDEDVLDHKTRLRLAAFGDFMWVVTEATSPSIRVDLRLTISDDDFLLLCGPGSDSMLRRLTVLFKDAGGGDYGSKIALRITKGPSNACIPFHCDGGYATATVQVNPNNPSNAANNHNNPNNPQ
jgi:hypothetical protein